VVKGKGIFLIKQKGVGEVYLEYTLKIHDLAVSRKKEMLMWADIILRHPEIIKELPRDITLLDWGYEANYPFERNCRVLQQSGVKFMVCAGTSSWTSIAGRTNNMLGNIASAAANAVKYGAQGMLVTDWGDMGHWQYLPVSYGGYATGGALSWNSKSMSGLPLTSFMNSYIFRDTRQIMGDLALDLGRYMQYEELPVPNMTTTMLALQFGLNDRLMNDALFGKIGHEITELMKDVAPEMVNSYLERIESGRPFDFTGLFTFLDEKEALLNNVSLMAEDGQLIVDEYRNAIRLLRIGGNLQYYIERRGNLSLQERRDVLQNISSWLNQYLDENRRLWIIRNKPGGYERSTAVLYKLLHQIDEQIVMLEEPALKRGLDRFTAMITAAVATLYLKVV